MDYFWGNIFEYFKDRRGPAVFCVALVAFFVVFAIGAAIFSAVPREDLAAIFICAASVLGLFFLISIISIIRRQRARARDRYKSSPLSRDELRKARSKLSGTKNIYL